MRTGALLLPRVGVSRRDREEQVSRERVLDALERHHKEHGNAAAVTVRVLAKILDVAVTALKILAVLEAEGLVHVGGHPLESERMVRLLDDKRPASR